MGAILFLLIFSPTVITHNEYINFTQYLNVLGGHLRDLIVEEKAEKIFIEEAKRIGVSAQSHVNACIESHQRTDGWFTYYGYAFETITKQFENFADHLNSAEDFLEYANETDPKDYHDIYKYVERINEALKDVNVEARLFVQRIPQKNAYQCLSSKAKRDLERKFCYFTSYLIYDHAETRKYVEYMRSSQCPSLKMEKVEQLIDGIDITKEEAAKIIREESNRFGIPAQALLDTCIDRRPVLEILAPKLLAIFDATIALIATKKLEESKWDTMDKFIKLAAEAYTYGYNSLKRYVEANRIDTSTYTISVLTAIGQAVFDEYLLIANNKSITPLEFWQNKAEIETQLIPKISNHYSNLTEYTKTDMEKKFCYFTFIRISPLSDIKELIADRIRDVANYGEL